ncbi:MAG: efflux RND transporter periplasmic adaptor subunit [Candidatus Aminicenantes bacterium]|nr:efflux RND transporter periplasmic adaptor subunit [Candidatus Aminicenantes bacterium]
MIFHKRTLVGALVILIAGAAAFFLFLRNGKEAASEETAEETSRPAQKAEEAGLPVRVAAVRHGELVMRLKSPGEAFTEKRIIVKAEVSGTIKNLNVREGKQVRAGDLLVELEDREYRLKLERADALRLRYLSELLLEKQFADEDKRPDSRAEQKIKQAEEEFSRASSLFSQGLLSRDEFETARRAYELVMIETGRMKEEIMAAAKGLTQAEIDVKIAQMELEKTSIRAPFSGVITDIRVSPGETISAGRELFTLVDISHIKVKAKVLESEVGKMKEGHEASLKFSAYPGKTFKGRVEAVSPVTNPEDKTCSVYISVENPAGEIKPGMHADVEIAADVYRDRLLVPQAAVLVRGGRKLVFVVEEDLAKWRYIDVGLENEEYAEVLDGVREGEKVVTEGHFTLAHDAKVRVTQAEIP